MPMTITNDKGEDILVLTQEEVEAQRAEAEAKMKAEYDAKIAENETRTKEKLDQLEKARTGADHDRESSMKIAEEARKIAEDAQKKVLEAEAEKIAAKKNYYIKSVSGNDPELTKKITEAYDMLNMPGTTDDEINARLQNAVRMAGVQVSYAPTVSFAGASAPSFAQNGPSEQEKAASYDQFTKELNLGDFIPKKNNQ